MNPIPVIRQFVRGVCALTESAKLENEQARAVLRHDAIAKLHAHIAELEQHLKKYDELSSGYLARAEAAESKRDSLRAQLEAKNVECKAWSDRYNEVLSEVERRHAAEERALGLECDLAKAQTQLDAVTRCCGQRMNYSPNPSNGKPFWFCPECGKELRPDYPYAGEPSEDCLRPLSPEDLAKVAPISEAAINEAIEKGRHDAEQFETPMPPGFYR